MRSLPASLAMLLAALGVGGVVLGAELAAENQQSALQACARITAAAERLACYDRLAPPAQSSPAPQAVVPAPGAAPAAAAAGAAAASSAAPPPPAAAAKPAAQAAPRAQEASPAQPAPPAQAPAAPAAAGATAAPAAAAAATAPSPQSFGLYAEEHPKPSVAPSLEANVAAVGKSAGGRMTVTLEGGALWELEDSDPLLAAGDVVTITRASLGSYLLHTPSHRTYRVRRLH